MLLTKCPVQPVTDDEGVFLKCSRSVRLFVRILSWTGPFFVPASIINTLFTSVDLRTTTLFSCHITSSRSGTELIIQNLCFHGKHKWSYWRKKDHNLTPALSNWEIENWVKKDQCNTWEYNSWSGERGSSNCAITHPQASTRSSTRSIRTLTYPTVRSHYIKGWRTL